MKLLCDRIRKDGRVYPGDILKVDSFLNHLIDVPFLCELGKEFYRLYEKDGVTKLLTVEASGIGIACITAQYFGVPVLFAKKSRSGNISSDVYASEVMSYTHGYASDVLVAREHLHAEDKVLIIDDFLAKGNALLGLIDICRQAGASVVGCGIAVEKVYQGGGELIRSMGYRVESLAMISSLGEDGSITFCTDPER